MKLVKCLSNGKKRRIIKMKDKNDFRKLLNHLIKISEKKSLTTYEEVANLLDLNLDNPEDHFQILPELLSDINEYMEEENKPMITALIVLKNSRPYTCGEGFFNLMNTMKKISPKEDKQLFWAKEISKIHNEDWSEI